MENEDRKETSQLSFVYTHPDDDFDSNVYIKLCPAIGEDMARGYSLFQRFESFYRFSHRCVFMRERFRGTMLNNQHIAPAPIAYPEYKEYCYRYTSDICTSITWNTTPDGNIACRPDICPKLTKCKIDDL